MLPKMLIHAGSRLIIAASNWSNHRRAKKTLTKMALSFHSTSAYTTCGSSGKSSANRVHAGERDKTHREKNGASSLLIDELPAMSRSLPSKRGR